MRARFYYPFLGAYQLESSGVISNWYVIKGDKKTIQLHDKEYICSRIEATIEDYRAFLFDTNQFSLSIEFEQVPFEEEPQHTVIPQIEMVTTVMRRLAREKHDWAIQHSRFIQWNLSYASLSNTCLSMEFFPLHLAIFFWKDERAYYIVTPYYYYKSATEILRRSGTFATECSNRIKSGMFETEYFYLSLVYSPEQVIVFMGDYIRGNRDFLHKNFSKWGRFTNSDDPRIYLPKGEYPLRKIRI
jgi:hypothetical protein